MSNLPDRTKEPDLDDTQGISLDLETLYNEYIQPIENMRSFGAPTTVDRPVIKDENAVANNTANDSDIDTSRAQESRAHAFYRMVGFPTINENLDFYSPGYDPTLKRDQKKKRYDISTKLSSTVRLATTLREQGARQRREVFSKFSVDSCVYALAIAVPTGIKKFQVMNDSENFNFINSSDEQTFNYKTRKDYLESRYSKRDGSAITNYFTTGSHILRPFTVDPNIEDTVVGFANQTRQVAAPFLPAKKDTGIERDIYAKRPGLEFILRLRIRAQESSKPVMEEFLSIYSDTETSDLTLVELNQVVSALLNEEGVQSDDILERLKNANNLEVINLNKMVKTIKGVIELLVKSVNDVKNVSKKIKWTPLPSENGPEFGSDSTNLVKTKQRTELRQRLLNLTTRSFQTRRIGTLSDDDSILSSDFHLFQFENVEKPFDKEIDKTEAEIDNFQQIGSDALSAIEIITGEISGFGLIDILAIYTALWAVPLEVLVSLLDENAFRRLYENKDLRSFDVELRNSDGPQMSVLEAMQAFEKQVINILAYSDNIFRNKLGPNTVEGGDVPRNT